MVENIHFIPFFFFLSFRSEFVLFIQQKKRRNIWIFDRIRVKLATTDEQEQQTDETSVLKIKKEKKMKKKTCNGKLTGNTHNPIEIMYSNGNAQK